MTNRKRYLKLVAFVPAIVLVGGFVGYRAGAFQSHSQPAPQPEPQPAAEQTPPAPDDKPTYMAGSKYMHIDIQPPGGTPPTVTPPPGAAAPNSPPAKPPTFLLGSKSAPVVPVTPTAPNPPKP